MRKASLVLATLLLLAIAAPAMAQTEEDPLGPGDHVPMCHATGSETNPYVFIEPSATSGGPAGHGGHEDDIFEGYWFQQNPNSDPRFVEGRNEHLAFLLDLECVQEPSPSPSPSPTEPSPSPTEPSPSPTEPTNPPPTDNPPPRGGGNPPGKGGGGGGKPELALTGDREVALGAVAVLLAALGLTLLWVAKKRETA